MGRPKKTVPDYRSHVSGQAVVTFNGTNCYLGEHDSPKSLAKFTGAGSLASVAGRKPAQDTPSLCNSHRQIESWIYPIVFPSLLVMELWGHDTIE